MAELPDTAPFSADLFRQCGHELVDAIADFLAETPNRRLSPSVPLDRFFGGIIEDHPVPLKGEPAASLLRETADLLFKHSVLTAHPKFFGFINASAHPLGALADLLASAVNPNVAAPYIGPIASAIERQTVAWLGELTGFGENISGILTSGGSVANIMGVHVARTSKTTWDGRKQGMTRPEAQKLRVYATDQTHSWLGKAAHVLGFGSDGIHWIPTDGEQRMSTAALRAAVEEDRRNGLLPAIVVATCGTTSTGAIDPMGEMSEVCREADLWLHVDAAYGGLAAVVKDAPEDVRLLSKADSLAVDPHKWLYVPFEAGCLLTKTEAALLSSFREGSSYYGTAGDKGLPPPFRELGLQTSRGFRALKVWLCLRHLGKEKYTELIGKNIELAKHLFRLADASPKLEARTCSLSITTLRYVPEGLSQSAPGQSSYLDRLNERIVRELQTSGLSYPSHAQVAGDYVIRVCVVNFNTTERDIQDFARQVEAIGDRLHGSGVA